MLDQVVAAARDGGAAADTLIARYFKTRRYAGSKDRRAVRDLVLCAIRRAGERAGERARGDDRAGGGRPELAELFDGAPNWPAPIARSPWPPPASRRNGSTRNCPPRSARTSARLAGARAARSARQSAQDDARRDRCRCRRRSPARFARRVPFAQRHAGREHAAFEQGLIEVQDEGSQLIAAACAAAPA